MLQRCISDGKQDLGPTCRLLGLWLGSGSGLRVEAAWGLLHDQRLEAGMGKRSPSTRRKS